MGKRRYLSVLCGLAAGALWVGAPKAQAGLTDVGPAANGEVGHEQILERIYGVDLAASGSGYSGGGFDVRRVDDSADGVLSFDQPRRVDLVAAFTGWTWDLGLEDASGRRVATAAQDGSGFDAGGGFDVPAGSGPLELTIEHASGRQYRSGDSLDQLVTYAVAGAEDAAAGDMLFFWEDWSRREGSDMDFNDLVLRTSAGVLGSNADDTAGAGGAAEAPASTSIPLPPSAWPGAVSMFTVTYLAVRRYRKRR